MMRLDLNPEFIRTCMRLWRDTIDLRVPMRDEFKVHMMGERRTILANFENVSDGWKMLLGRATPDSPDEEAFRALVAEIEEFNAWAKGQLDELRGEVERESLRDSIHELLADPDIKRQFQDLAEAMRKKPPARGK